MGRAKPHRSRDRAPSYGDAVDSNFAAGLEGGEGISQVEAVKAVNSPRQMPVPDIAYVINNTGELWHVYEQRRGGALLKLQHDLLPSYTLKGALGVIADQGVDAFSVRIMR